jgi:hypothetical protein
LDGVGNSIRLLNWLMDNKSKKKYIKSPM